MKKICLLIGLLLVGGICLYFRGNPSESASVPLNENTVVADQPVNLQSVAVHQAEQPAHEPAQKRTGMVQVDGGFEVSYVADKTVTTKIHPPRFNTDGTNFSAATPAAGSN